MRRSDAQTTYRQKLFRPNSRFHHLGSRAGGGQIAFGSFIVSGPLASWFYQDIGLVLFGNFATGLTAGLGSCFRGAIAGLSPALVIVMALIGFSIVAKVKRCTLMLTLGAINTGLCCLLPCHEAMLPLAAPANRSKGPNPR